MMRAPILKSAIAAFSLMFFAPLAIAQEGTGATSEQIQTLNIPAGPMSDALDALVKQSGIQLIYRDADVAGITTAGVSGETTVDAALDVLLQGTELVVTRDASGAMAVGTPNAFADTGADAGPFADGGENANVAAARRAGVEEIIVTGQKKEERLQDVPIAISAFSMEQLDAQKIEGGFDLLKAIPNVTFSKTNFSGYNFQIRGVGTQSISATSDPGVAVSFNNIAIIQNRLFEQEYLDVERVEVLRGPQGTLYGRNATAGVINVISHKPELGVWGGELDLEVGNYQAQRIRGMVNIPLGETFAARAAFAMTDREGYTFNSGTDSQVDGRDLWTGRLSLAWQPSDVFRAHMVWERFEEDDDRLRTGKQLCYRDDGPETVGGLSIADTITNGGPGDPLWDREYAIRRAIFSQGCEPGSLFSDGAFDTPNGLANPLILPLVAAGGVGFTSIGRIDGQDVRIIQRLDPYGGKRQSTDLRVIESVRDPVYRANADLVEISIDFDLTETITFSSQTAYADDETYSFQDFNRFNSVPIFTDTTRITPGFGNGDWTDFAPNGIFCDPQIGCSDTIAGFDIAQAEAKQWTQEFRFQSAFDGPINFSFGANYTQFESLVDYYVFFNVATALAWTAPFNLPGNISSGQAFDPNICHGSIYIPISFDEFSETAADDPMALCPYVDQQPLDTSRNFEGDGHNYYRSKNPYDLESWAGFGEIYWNVIDNVKVTAGLRYTRDKKTFTPVPTQFLLSPSLVGGGTTSIGYPELPDIEQKWGEWTGRLVIDWKPETRLTDETLIYSSYSRGYKGGGANPPTPGFATFDEITEIALSQGTQQAVIDFFGANGLLPVLNLNADEYEPTFRPEFVNAYEIGSKNTLFSGALMLNATAFYYNYDDYQVSQIRDRTAINENFDAEMWGIELESILAPTPNWQMIANIGYLKTRIGDGEASINIMDRTQGSPDYVLVKPWIQIPSNCVTPTHVAEEFVSGMSGGGIAAWYQMCGGVGGLAGSSGGPPFDSVTGTAYDPLATDANGDLVYPEINGGAGIKEDVSGNELPQSPNFTLTLGSQYGFDMGRQWRGTVRADYYWQGKSFHRIYNDDPYDQLKSWSNTNLSFWVENDVQGLTIEAYVKNLFDQQQITGAFLNSDDTNLTTNIFVFDPRLIGLSIKKEF